MPVWWDEMTTRTECDLVMKGGITSGVVYPEAVLKLHEEYDFRSIGGASAGAIAAAATAAAQYGESQASATTAAPQHGESIGFAGLKALNEELRQPGKLIELFQPTPAARPLLEVFLAALRGVHQSKGWRAGLWCVLYILCALVMRVPVALVLGALAGLALSSFLISLVHGAGPFATAFVILATVCGALLGSLVQFVAILLWVLPKQGFGICRLHAPGPSGAKPPLTEWLFTRFDEMAGMAGTVPARALTFGDLKSQNIQLELITTNLSQLRPYVLPFEDNRFLFKQRELEEYFPKYVVDQMVRTSHAGSSVNPPPGFFFLPSADQLPIGFGVRLSLSFPILICAVPLYTIRLDAFSRRVAGQPLQLAPADMKRNWFSDGGICSNFPIHFFDHWLPRRPTFGISLGKMPADEVSTLAQPLEGMPPAAGVAHAAEAVHLPKANRPEAAAWHELNSILDLLKSMFDTMMSYRDTMQSQLPGFRERIVEIRLTPDEGGLNLDMNPKRIGVLAEKGTRAGELFRSFNFDEHRWVRLQVLLPPLADELEHLAQNHNKFGGWPDAGKPYTRNSQWLAAMQKCLDALASTADDKRLQPLMRVDPKPAATVRVAPKI